MRTSIAERSRCTRLIPATIVAAWIVAFLLTWTRPANALPSFSRKYNIPCATCHDAPLVPRLNDVGYKFRRAGFRMPENIGQEETQDFTLDNYLSAHLALEASVTETFDRAVSPATSNATPAFTQEISFHPLTGSFAKHWATQSEVAFSFEEGFSIENAYLRGVWGNKDTWFEARAGAFHAFEGFGASDRPIGISFPLFETHGAGLFQDTLFRFAEPSRAGGEVGLQWKNTSLTVQALSGLVPTVRGAEVEVEGIAPEGAKHPAVTVFANQILGAHSGISAYWTHGTIELPIDPEAFVAGSDTSTWTNTFDRGALFASFGVKQFIFLAGGEVGVDQARDPTSGALSHSVSTGAFLEADYAPIPPFAIFARGDYFNPAVSLAHNHQAGLTMGMTVHSDWLYVIGEIQYRSIAEGETQSGAVAVRAIAIY